jgi:hypothetical protein
MLPSSFWSAISDGMAQSHNMLPHFAMQQSWTDGLPQHLQGVLNHNRGMTIYRTFHNINNCANVAIHAFLSELEKTLREEGKIPDTVYYQIDGGSENTANCWFALCELLVARRVCKKIVLTRLMVGHTHEDIDARFGTLWKHIRNKFVYTPQEYARCIIRALSTKKHACTVVDFIAIPDYKSHLDKLVDPEFKPFCKEEKTSLQWTFEAVTPDEHFPHGVRVLHRAYSADEVVEILEDSSKPCGMHAKLVEVFDFPMKEPEKGIMVDGMTILTSLPSTKPEPFPFVADSRELLDDVLYKVETKFTRNHSTVVDAWKEWAATVAPKNNDVIEYVRDHPLHFPLGNILFSDEPMDVSPVQLPADSAFANLERMRSTDCVRWSRWGISRDDTDLENVARIERVMVNGVEVERNALPAAQQIWRRWKKRKAIKADETGDFAFILAQSGRTGENRSPFTVEGQLIKLRTGGKRAYWRNKRSTTFYGEDDLGDNKSFEYYVAEGSLRLGAVTTQPVPNNITTVQPTPNNTDVVPRGSGEPSRAVTGKRQRRDIKGESNDEEDEKEDSGTDSDNDDDGWLTCVSKFFVPRQVCYVACYL